MFWPLLTFASAGVATWLFIRGRKSSASSKPLDQADPWLPGNTVFVPGPGGVDRWKTIKEGKRGDEVWWEVWALPKVFGNATELFVLRYVDTPAGRFFGGLGGEAKQSVVDAAMREFSISPNYPPGSAGV